MVRRMVIVRDEVGLIDRSSPRTCFSIQERRFGSLTVLAIRADV